MKTTSIAVLTHNILPLCSAAFFSTVQRSSMAPREPPALFQAKISPSSSVCEDDTITILGFGSLLSEKSSRLTFPDLTNFRLGRVQDYRRVFAHPASIFFSRGIANFDTLEFASLSVEYEKGYSLIVSAFEVSSKDMMINGVPSLPFMEREEEFNITPVPFVSLTDNGNDDDDEEELEGIICARSTDKSYLDSWGEERFNEHYKKYGIDTIWGWKPDSGLRPCSVYLRHCYLSAKGMGEVCFNSFLDDTYLVDRQTTIRQYVEKYPEVLNCKPPPALASRYSG
jgi:hypothetical protein